jgi:hypothetical protein
MRKITAALGIVVPALAVSILACPPAVAATGDVTVFSLETVPVTVYHDPVACQKLPPGAHVLVNQTEDDVRIYADPLCLTPSLTIHPGYGSHVAPGSGSFSA